MKGADEPPPSLSGLIFHEVGGGAKEWGAAAGGWGGVVACQHAASRTAPSTLQRRRFFALTLNPKLTGQVTPDADPSVTQGLLLPEPLPPRRHAASQKAQEAFQKPRLSAPAPFFYFYFSLLFLLLNGRIITYYECSICRTRMKS